MFCKKNLKPKKLIEKKKPTDWNQCFFFHICDVKILPPKLQNWLKLHYKNIFLQNFLEFLIKKKSENLYNKNTDWNLWTKNFNFRIFFCEIWGLWWLFFSQKNKILCMSCSGFFCGQVRKTYPQKIKWWLKI